MSPGKITAPLLHESSFNASDNPHTSSEFFKICEDYGVPNDPMKDFIGLINTALVGLMTTLVQTLTCWIIEKSQGFTDVGLY